MARLPMTPRRRSSTPAAAPVPTPRREIAVQLLSGAVLGAGAVYVAAVARRGPVVALVIVLIGLSYLLRNRGRVQWVARGFLASGLAALAAVLVVLVLGHDLF